MLPTPDFATSNMTAIQDRNIDIDTIRQSFAQNPFTQTLPLTSGGGETRNIQQIPELTVPPGTLGTGSELDYGTMDLSNPNPSNGWQMSLGDFDDDLLFGVLGGSWP